MYSQEERMAAVDAYINSNFNENYVIRTLGYPSPNALRSWYKEYKATGTLHEKSRPKPRYTQAQKEKAVTYYAEHHISLTQACSEICFVCGYRKCGRIGLVGNKALAKRIAI